MCEMRNEKEYCVAESFPSRVIDQTLFSLAKLACCLANNAPGTLGGLAIW